MSLIFPIVLPLIFALFIGFTGPLIKRKYFYALVPFSIFLFFFEKFRSVREQGSISEVFNWYESLGINLHFKLDSFSLLMCLLISGIGALIFLYGYGYLKASKHIDRFYLILSIFMAGMFGIVISDNLIVLFIFWEITTITSYLLVGFKHEDEKARKSAQQALLITGIGGLCLLAGILILGFNVNTFTISELPDALKADVNQNFITASVILILLGCFTKSAQFPFHFWLPNAMAAPTPVSAYLHSATMVKAGVYLIYRLNEVFLSNDLWSGLLIIVGGTTMLFAALSGLFYKDLKKILAYSTVSVLGILTLLAGIGTELSIVSGISVLLGHALYKATLFMVAGNIDHETGTRDISILGGLKKYMPWTFGAAFLAAISQAGFPPTAGFLGKEYFYKSGLYSENVFLLVSISVAASIVLVVLALTIGLHPFTKDLKKDLPKKPHEAPLSMLAGPVILGLCGLFFGIFSFALGEAVFLPAAKGLGFNYAKQIYLWEGINSAFILSVLTVLAGVFLYLQRQRVWVKAEAIISGKNFRFDKLYSYLLNHFIKFSKWQTKVIQNGSLRSYLIISLCGFLLLLSLTFFSLENIPYQIDFTGIEPALFLLIIVMGIAAVLASFSPSLIYSIICLGLIGFGMPIIYMMYGAPDLAITQILVEILTAVMFMAVIYKLPKFRVLKKKSKILLDGAIALTCGVLVTLMIFKSHALQLSDPVSDKMAEISYLEAKGRNIVNVILVDFRALDTLGEIAVLLIAVIGSSVLVKRLKREESA